MDSSSAFQVIPQNNSTAHVLLHLFIQEYGLGQRVPREYKPAKLVLEMLERVTSKDAERLVIILSGCTWCCHSGNHSSMKLSKLPISKALEHTRKNKLC
ncbi:hypothetical protein BO85DRAFT_220913 [Aspergillus piperis CBS 112811]|uniref:Uncharacterized protein n=1 Tax=Aspergillus piperis CBS 112811 TaxID=1448313 RepID=A0A8G1VPX0_9EURO|nr:hypothetical protein BO85DRAFT_220913 [Aspergillus piperis CBS 112811]RAH60157.1 hypothetical protein BO85DRAFT_220913 [Aspergillus piperis CBS 112811]